MKYICFHKLLVINGLKKFCSVMDLPKPVGSKPYNTILKKLAAKSVIEAEIVMKNAW